MKSGRPLTVALALAAVALLPGGSARAEAEAPALAPVAAVADAGVAEVAEALPAAAAVDAGATEVSVTAPVPTEGPPADDVDDEPTTGAPEEAGLADEAVETEAAEAAPAVVDAGYRYSGDVTDEELARRWKEDPASLGSVSIGRPEEGRLINAMPFPEGTDGGAWTVIVPESCWTTQETADAIIGAANQLREWFPEGAPVRVGQVSGKEGGYLPPHVTHQNGRDIDVGLFYPGPEPHRVREREKVMDVPMNWGFAKAMLMHGDVQHILLDRRVQKVLYDYALKSGEDRAWLDSLFHGPKPVFRHARKHRDHFHVRLWNARAQELAWRLAPLMPTRPEENVAFHRVKRGDTLGGIAVRYGSSVKKLMARNHLSKTLLRVGMVLTVQLRGPCTNCPVPPRVVVPPRRLPPKAATSAVGGGREPQG